MNRFRPFEPVDATTVLCTVCHADVGEACTNIVDGSRKPAARNVHLTRHLAAVEASR